MVTRTNERRNAAGWAVVAVAYLGGLAIACTQNKVPPSMDVIMEAFSIDMVTVGWLTSVFAVMGMVSAIPAAFILDRLGPKRSGLLSLGFATLGSILGAFSSNAAVLMLSRVVEGMGAGIIAIIAPALISMWFPSEKRGLPMGVWTSWMPTGQSLMFLVGGGISASLGWQGVWWFTALMCLAVMILYAWKVREPSEDQNFAPAEEGERLSLREGFASGPMWKVCIAGILFNIGGFSFCTWAASYWSEAFAVDLLTSNLWISIVYIIEIAMCFLAGLVLNRVKSVKNAGAVGFAFYAVLLFLAFRIESKIALAVYIVAWAVGEGLTAASIWTLSPQTAITPKYIGLAAGVLSVGLNIGILIGPPLSGALVSNLGWHATSLVLAAIEVAAMVLVFSIRVPNSAAKERS